MNTANTIYIWLGRMQVRHRGVLVVVEVAAIEVLVAAAVVVIEAG